YITPLGHAIRPAVTWADLAAHASGLICLTGGPEGSFGRLLGIGQTEAAENLLLHLRDIYGDRLYVELMRHGTSAEAAIEDAQLDLAFRHGIPIVATNNCYFA